MPLRRTEQPHAAAAGLQDLPDEAILRLMLDSHLQAAGAVAAGIEGLGRAAALMAGAVAAGRRLIYAGAGSSGLMALADALELPATFGVPEAQVVALIPGGAPTLLRMTGVPEDREDNGKDDLARVRPEPGDVAICVSASGSTPYTLGAARAARAAGAQVVAIANAAGAPLLAEAEVAVLLDTGPEIVAGSTRLSAATAQKIALNMISTLMGIRLGHVHDGLMINLTADNAKLHARSARIVAALAHVGEAAARRALEATGGQVKLAIVVAATGVEPDRAAALLDAGGGDLRAAIEAARI